MEHRDGVFNSEALAGGLYYLLHSTLIVAVLFLIADQVAQRRGDHGDSLASASSYPQMGLLAGFFFLAAIAMVGMPPLSGFVGKLLILDSVRASSYGPWIWAFVLGTSVLALLGFARAGSQLFWKPSALPAGEAVQEEVALLPLIAIALLLSGIVALTAFSGPVTAFLYATADQLIDPADYIAAVLNSRPVPAQGRDARRHHVNRVIPILLTLVLAAVWLLMNDFSVGPCFSPSARAADPLLHAPLL